MDEFKVSEGESKVSSWHQMKRLGSIKPFRYVLAITLAHVTLSSLPSVFMPAYGAEYFAGCTDKDEDCEFDYSTYQFYQTLFMSLRGLMALLFAGFVGRLSDAYGRKPFLIFSEWLFFQPYIPLLLVDNIWIYFVLYGLAGLIGSNTGLSPVLWAYLADTLPQDLRTFGYGAAYTAAAVGLFTGSGCAVVTSMYLGTTVNLIIIAVCALVIMIGIYFFVPESLQHQDRKALTLANANPFQALFHIRKNPVIFWIAIVHFAISLPETGVIDTMVIYVLDQLNVQSEARASQISASMISICGLGLIGSNMILLPILKKRFTDFKIILLGSIGLVISMCMFALVSVMQSGQLVIACLACILLTCGLLAFPAAGSMATRYVSKSEQGMAFGIIYGVRGVTYMVAPFLFGYGYILCKSINMPWLIYTIAALFCSLVIPCIIGPLKKTLQDTHKYQRKYSFSQKIANIGDNQLHEDDLTQINNVENRTKDNNMNEMIRIPKNSKDKKYHAVGVAPQSLADE